MKFLKNENVTEKKVIVRGDLDVPLENGQIEDATRIEKTIPTLKKLLDNKNQIFLISHVGRPSGRDPKLSFKLILPKLEELLGEKVAFKEDFDQSVDGKIVLFDNLRFWSEEEANDLEFAKKLASFGEVYVNECFSVAHRGHASVALLPTLLPSYAGLELGKEVMELQKILENPERPLVAIIGGAKLETKLPAITNLAKVADKVLVGGKLMFEIGNTVLPENVVVAVDNIDQKDIGPSSLELFKREIEKAKTLVWNGPLGLFEETKYALGTKKIAEMVANSSAYSLVGGGDTIAALKEIGMLQKVDFVSVGGGAMLEFLEGKKLPALIALGFYES